MLENTTAAALLPTYSTYIKSETVREALQVILDYAADLPDWAIRAKPKGLIHDFRFFNHDKQQFFVLIPAPRALLFYIRMPAVYSCRYKVTEIDSIFQLEHCSNGEWKIFIHTREEAEALCRYLFEGKPLNLEAA